MQSLRRQLDSLGVSLGNSFDGGTRSRKNKNAAIRQAVLVTVASLALLFLIASWWISRTVLASTQQNARDSLQAVLSANVAVLQNWFASEEDYVARMASNDTVQTSAIELIAKSDLSFQWDNKDLSGLDQFTELKQALHSDKHVGWCITNTRDTVVASSIDDLVGQPVTISDHARRSIMSREPTILLPFQSEVAITSTGPLSVPGGPVMAAMMSLLEEEQVVGNLVMLIDPLDRFSELLSIARTGASGETYAFDRDGVMLSQSRFEDQLRVAGMLPEDPNIVSTLNVMVRDPGVNIVAGQRPTTSPNEQRLTVMADHATRGGSSENLTGYNDYRGVKVVGVWTWLSKYQMGIATEADVDEVLAPARFLNRSFFAALAMLAIASAGLLFFGFRNEGNHFNATKNSSGEDNINHRRFGRYELGEMLGRGGMGSVYRGKHELLRRPVAIKVLTGRETGSTTGSMKSGSAASGSASLINPDSITRFEREVQLTASLRHPNTIHIYDYGRADDGTFFYVMEFVDGITLQQLIDDFGAQPPARVIHLLLQICGSLREAHLSGLIHRDVKPANILLTSEAGVIDWIKVLDFGLIKSVTSTAEDQSLTQSDTITGTPMYMSPECVRDATESDALSDLYSLGAVGYALLTGKPIFEGTGSVDICMKQLNEMPLRPENRLESKLPDDLQNVLMSCLRKDPKDRPQSIDELASALRSCADAISWTESDAIHWWEVVYSNARSSSNGNDMAKQDHDTLENKTLENEV